MDGPEPTPPVAPLEDLLDFHSRGGAAGFKWFQRVCIAILEVHPNFRDVVPVGIEGEAQEGLDIRSEYVPTEKPWGFQCKQEANFGPADVTNAINKVPEAPTY